MDLSQWRIGGAERKPRMALMQFCTASMSAIMKLTKHGAIIPTHTPCLVIANMADMEAVQNCISAAYDDMEACL